MDITWAFLAEVPLFYFVHFNLSHWKVFHHFHMITYSPVLSCFSHKYVETLIQELPVILFITRVVLLLTVPVDFARF